MSSEARRTAAVRARGFPVGRCSWVSPRPRGRGDPEPLAQGSAAEACRLPPRACDVADLTRVRWQSPRARQVRRLTRARPPCPLAFVEQNYCESRYHFLHSADGEGCAHMLVEYSTSRGFRSEVDMFVAQAVLQ